jgi:hypothetical protein
MYPRDDVNDTSKEEKYDEYLIDRISRAWSCKNEPKGVGMLIVAVVGIGEQSPRNKSASRSSYCLDSLGFYAW